jgi:ubiquitin carboxyl-terminal hydrolase 34
MTMEDNDTVIADRPVRSPRAPSSEPSLACRDDSSTDEDDISITRKRPRLDSGSRAVRSISADVVLAPSARETNFKMEQSLKEEIRSPPTARSAVTPKYASESPILAGSSPSIPIEIAELEDVDDDRNAATAIEIEGDDDDLVDRFIEQFPYLNSGNKPINMAKQVTKHLETELDVDKDFLRNMIHWLSTQDNTFRGQKTYWHELFYGHAVLWK